ncbi:MAG: DUF6600 domain-containing protein [Bacteroidota bacterium]
MKRFIQTAALALLIMLGGSWRNTVSAQPGDDNYGGEDVSYQAFYDELSPHGRWIDYPEYGYVWVPNGIDGFRPYETSGHWVWTDDYEWMWVSDYSWGWAPFHYGRWFSDPYYGWMWMPGYEWSPAWVAWRDGGDYYGWAPLRPGFNIGINISIGNYDPPVDYWCFAPRRYISSPRIYDYCIDRGRNVTIISNTTIINNYGRRNNVFYNGPRRADAERYAGRINPVRFRESSRPGRSQFRNNEVSIYRPRVSRDDNRQFTPRSFDRYDRNRNNNSAAGRNNGNANNSGNAGNRPGGRNVFDRRNNDATTQGNNGNNNSRPERRNVFDRGNNNNQQQPGNNRNTERKNVFDRRNNEAAPQNNNGNQPRNNDRTVRRPFEQRNTETRPQPQNNGNNNRQPERRNVFDRNNNTPSQPGRQMRSPERQPSQQADRQQPRQSQPRFESRGGNSQQPQQRGGGNSGGRGRRG